LYAIARSITIDVLLEHNVWIAHRGRVDLSHLPAGESSAKVWLDLFIVCALVTLHQVHWLIWCMGHRVVLF
jgi:hypothetical protein